MTDPEDSLELLPAGLAETEVDAADEFERAVPLEAEPADVLEQKRLVDADEDEYRE